MSITIICSHLVSGVSAHNVRLENNAVLFHTFSSFIAIKVRYWEAIWVKTLPYVSNNKNRNFNILVETLCICWCTIYGLVFICFYLLQLLLYWSFIFIEILMMLTKYDLQGWDVIKFTPFEGSLYTKSQGLKKRSRYSGRKIRKSI